MKIIFSLITIALIGSFNPCFARQDIKDLRQMSVPNNLKEINISGHSKISHADAMNRLSKIAPQGYAISTIKYIKTKDEYIVVVKLIKL